MKEFKLLITSDNEDLNQKAIQLSKKIKLPFAGLLADLKKNYENHEDIFLLVVSEDLIYLKKGLTLTSKPIYCDFYKWSKENKRSNLVRSMRGLPHQGVIIDATAGLGRDALILSSLVERVILIERVPWVSALLEDGLKNSRKLLPYLSSTQVICCDSKKYLLNLKTKPDAIYLDPMFEKMGKSKAKREIQALRDLTIQSNEEELLEVALKTAKDRVVVKRHKKIKSLSGLKPTFSLTGRVVRYDVYSIS
jgi:16S rRNA (guanine1516-N2)-methyltransferase|tara:strand:- start:82 stop:831 length:750 start_codon:yes stop_codon:yes gene_type:complete